MYIATLLRKRIHLTFALILYSLPINCFALQLEIAVKDFKESVTCSEADFKTIEVIAERNTTNEKKYNVKFDKIYHTDIVNDTLVCQRLLSEFKKNLLTNNKKFIKFELVKIKQDSYYFKDNKLKNYCLEIGFCYENFLDYFKLNKKLHNCRSKTSWKKLIETTLPRKIKPSFKAIPEMDVQIFPIKTFVEKSIEFAHNSKDEDVFFSTMSIAKSSLKLLDAKMPQDKNIYINIDAGLLFNKDEAKKVYNILSKNKNITLFPQTSGERFKTLYHIKYLLDSSSKAVLTSMNLSTSRKAAYLDLIYNFNDKSVTNELRDFSKYLNYYQCENLENLTCLAEFSNFSIDLNPIKKICQKAPKARLPNPSYFITTLTHRPLDLLVEMIGKAKKQVLVSTYKFSLRKVAKALELAKARGVEVNVFTTHSTIFHKKNPDYYFYTKDKKGVIDPHMKVVLIDGETLFFGTGSLTINGFFGSAEMYAVSNSKKAIKTTLSLFNSYKRYFEMNQTDFKVKEKLPKLLVLEKDNLEKYNKYYEREVKAWMRNRYLKLSNEFTKKAKTCNYDKSLFISEKEFIKCVEKLNK